MKKQLLTLSLCLSFATQFMFATVIKDANGWTVVTASSDSRIVYVSDSFGIDTNNGLSAATAKKTIAAGIALIRDGYPDHLLLKRGDTFTNQILSNGWTASGRSANEPILIGTYGTGARPRILTGNSSCFNTHPGQQGSGSNIVIMGLYIEPHRRQATTPGLGGIRFNQFPSHITIEDCYITGFGGQISIQRSYNVAIRRNILTNAWNIDSIGHSQGLFVGSVDSLLIEENFLDHNGWHDTIPGAHATIFNHNMYITGLGIPLWNVIIRGNISSRASSMGLKFQPLSGNHIIENNVFVRNGFGMQIGGGTPQGQNLSTYPTAMDGFTITATNNVITEGDNMGNGFGVTFAHIASGNFSNNIIANKRIKANQVAIGFVDGVGWECQGHGIQNLTIDSNIVYNWQGDGLFVMQPTQGNPVPIIRNVNFTNNHMQSVGITNNNQLMEVYTDSASVIAYSNNTYYNDSVSASSLMRIGASNSAYSAWVSSTGETGSSNSLVNYTDPTRTVTTYAATLGLTDYDSIVNKLKLQSISNWQTQYTAQEINCYIRAGFDRGTCSATASIGTVNAREKNVLLYPNPAVNELNFIFKNTSAGTLAIYDITGKIIETVMIGGQDRVSLNIEKYSPGIYFYTLADLNSVMYTGKFSVIK